MNLLMTIEESFKNIKSSLNKRYEKIVASLFNRIKLKYKSIKETEPFDEYHLVKTFKELYCIICHKYDCYHGLQDNATFCSLTEESNCDLSKAFFFLEDFEKSKEFFYFFEGLRMGELIKVFSDKKKYFSNEVPFDCKNDCFLMKEVREVVKRKVSFNFLQF